MWQQQLNINVSSLFSALKPKLYTLKALEQFSHKYPVSILLLLMRFVCDLNEFFDKLICQLTKTAKPCDSKWIPASTDVSARVHTQLLLTGFGQKINFRSKSVVRSSVCRRAQGLLTLRLLTEIWFYHFIASFEAVQRYMWLEGIFLLSSPLVSGFRWRYVSTGCSPPFPGSGGDERVSSTTSLLFPPAPR